MQEDLIYYCSSNQAHCNMPRCLDASMQCRAVMTYSHFHSGWHLARIVSVRRRRSGHRVSLPEVSTGRMLVIPIPSSLKDTCCLTLIMLLRKLPAYPAAQGMWDACC